MTQVTLLPCPFCGEVESLHHLLRNEKAPPMPSGNIIVMCGRCAARTGWCHSYEGADERWNTRAPQWISVEDRLPGWEKSYLWQYTTAKGVVTMKVQKYQHVSAAWFRSVYTAWMPLPEPYQTSQAVAA